MPKKKRKSLLRRQEPGESSKPTRENLAADMDSASSLVNVGGKVSAAVKTAKVASAAVKASNPARGLMVRELVNYAQPIIGARLGAEDTKSGNVSVEKTKQRAKKLVDKVKSAKKALF